MMKRFLCLFLSLLMLLTVGCSLAEGGADARVITDQLAPVIKSVVADQDTYVPGDTVYITVTATDKAGFNEYGWQSCELYVEYTDIDGAYGYMYPSLEMNSIDIEENTATILFSYTLPEGAIPGIYVIDWIAISDMYGNYVSCTYPSVCRFTVKNQQPAPLAKVTSVKLNRTSVKKGSTIKLTATVENAVDDEWANSAYFYNQENWNTIDFTFHHVSGNKYEAVTTVPGNIDNGTYELGNISFTNSDGVRSNGWFDLSFKVKGSGSDDSKPTVTSVKVNKTKFTDGDEIKVTVKTDRALENPERDELYFTAGSSGFWFSGLKKVGKNEYSAAATVEEWHTAGAYTFDAMYVYNPDAEYTEYCAYSGDPVTFMLYDKKFVKLQSFTLNKSKVTVYLKSNSNESRVQLRMNTWKPAKASVLSLDFSISNPDIGWVSSDGSFCAYQPGKTVITATAKDGSGKTATCTITVKKVTIDKITLNKSKLSMRKGKVTTLSATFKPAKNLYNDRLYWYSDDPSVAKVDSAGNVTAVGKGKCTIYACAQDGGEATASCKITVK